MADTRDTLYAINRRLEGELARLDRSRNATLFLGVLLFCAVSGYLYFLNAQAAPHANAGALSNILAFQISKTVPGIIDSSKNNVLKMLPAMTGPLKAEFLKSVVSLRVNGNRHLVSSMSEVFRHVDLLLKEEIRRQGGPYREKIGEMLKTLSDPSLAQGELERIDSVLEAVIFDAVDRELTLGLARLQKLEKQIAEALEKEGGSEQDQLIKKFIIYWVNFYQHAFKMQ